MNDASSLTNQFLIAMPAMQDPNFSQTVIYICEHNNKGAMGLVLNRPTHITLGELFDPLNLECKDPLLEQKKLLIGGPVRTTHGFILHQPIGNWEASMPITDNIALTSSNDILATLAAGKGPEDIIITLGYTGWGPGQLEQEIRDNAWLNTPADLDLLFKTEPDQLWRAAPLLIGVDFSCLSRETGHA